MMSKPFDGKKDDSLGLHSAAMNGNVGLVKFALDHGAAIDSVVNGYMPLQLACINENHIAVVQYLIDRGADVNAQRWSKKHSTDKSQAVAGATGSTALHVACANGCTKIVDLLLRNGAKINVRDKYGSRPIDVAAAKHHTEIVKLLETFGSMQIMLKGLQEGQNNVPEAEISRRSMDASLYQKRERLRRPSLPSVFESLTIPDISTLPIDNKEDWYSYGVVNRYDDENYLASLERRAYGLPSPNEETAEPQPLKRSSSTDGHHLRATALMNAMAANTLSTQDDESNVIPVDDEPEEEETKKSWWNPTSTRKSIDAYYPTGRPSLEKGRNSLDFRPSLDSLSQLAKKSIDGLSRKSIDFDHIPEKANNNNNRGFFKWWSTQQNKK
ncbi:ankyrin repeat-containing domain protein [Gilbertella persicaria]|uniref:Uncharacterized protein n=1 Tax=Rhizopus stolonifer TaxID=4846 RepID=A0A367K0L3_RHIST|nr:ankyrin repeat-containing domain protein [Gilbertella persicaria]KAI8098360.1 ankyrin repeat-containing domain protein [Gilbertella persicaria]RCH95782.1 hypothetical protein CU098_010627 [Rhizopus stolonifer]